MLAHDLISHVSRVALNSNELQIENNLNKVIKIVFYVSFDVFAGCSSFFEFLNLS